MHLRPQPVVPGYVVIVSSEIELHGVAIMSGREGREFGVDVPSDCAPPGGLVRSMLLAVTPDSGLRTRTSSATPPGTVWPPRATRPPRSPVPASPSTRPRVPRERPLGPRLDPSTWPKGKLVAFVPREHAETEAALHAMRAYPAGREATVIGEAGPHPAGGTRVADQPIGEQLPRIC